MGKRNGAYKANFPEGTLVRVKGRPFLEDFKCHWEYHTPLKEIQLDYAGCEAKVISVGFYFGGDELYVLDGLRGVWHECCLELAI